MGGRKMRVPQRDEGTTGMDHDTCASDCGTRKGPKHGLWRLLSSVCVSVSTGLGGGAARGLVGPLSPGKNFQWG
eukprot:6969196-Pyramimonas_sp.AAC.1